jgi:LytTr DNA-binding domain
MRPSTTVREGAPKPRLWGSALAPVAAGWSGVFVLSGALAALGRVARGASVDPLGAVLEQAPILILWGVVTPFVFVWTRRWPVRAPHARRHLATHGVLALAVVVAMNAVIRVPLLAGGGLSPFLRSLGNGLSVYLPGALLAYGALLLVAHLRSASAGDGASDALGPRKTNDAHGRIAVRTPMRTFLLPFDDVVWVEADDNYVVVHTRDCGYRTRSSVSAVMRELPPGAFVRIHRSHLVSAVHIRQVQPLGNGDQVVVMDDGAELRVARGRRAALADTLAGVRSMGRRPQR